MNSRLSFCQEGDVLMVLNFNIFDLDFYQFNGKNGDASLGWTYNTSDPNTGDPVSETITDSTLVVLPADRSTHLRMQRQPFGSHHSYKRLNR